MVVKEKTQSLNDNNKHLKHISKKHIAPKKLLYTSLFLNGAKTVISLLGNWNLLCIFKDWVLVSPKIWFILHVTNQRGFEIHFVSNGETNQCLPPKVQIFSSCLLPTQMITNQGLTQ